MIRRFLLGLGLMLLALVLALGWVVGTRSGGAWALSMGLGQHGRFDAFSGSLLESPEITGLVYDSPGQRVTARRLALRWRPWALLDGLLHLESVQADGLEYERRETGPAPQPEPAEPGGPPSLPLAIRLDDAALTDARITTPGGTWTIDRAGAAARAAGGRVELERFEVVALGARAQAKGSVELTEAYPFRVEIDWTADLPETGPLAGAGSAEGSLAGLRIQHRVTSPFVLETSGRLDLGDAMRLTLSGQWTGARWPLQGDPQVRSPAGSFRLNGPLDALELSASAGLDGPGVPGADIEASGLIGAEGLTDARVLARLPGGEIRVTGEATWAPQLSWSARLEGQGLDPALIRPDLTGRVDLTADVDGGVGPDGLRSDIRLETLSGRLMDQELSGTARATLRDQGLRLEALDLASGPSRLGVSGEMAWSPAVTWDVDVEGQNLDPSIGWPRWPGRIDLAGTVQGGMEKDGPRAEVVIRTLKGTLRDQPLSGTGQASYRPGRLTLDGVRLVSGPNSLRASGLVAERLDLDLDLDAPDIAASWPDLQGAASAKARLTGTAEAPALDAAIEASGLRHQAGRVERLSVQAVWAPDRVDASATVDRVAVGDWTAESTRIRMTGRPEAFDTRLALDAETLDLEAVLSGGWAQGAWTGQLSGLSLAKDPLGTWVQTQPADLTLAADRVHAGRLCLAREGSRLCATAGWSPDRTEVRAELDQVALAMFEPWLPEGTAIEGAASGQADVRIAGGEPEGKAEIRLTPVTLSLEVADGEPLAWAFAEGRIGVEATAKGISADASLPLITEGGLSARVRLGPGNAQAARSLSGRVDAELPDLAPIAIWVPALTQVSGGLTAKLDLAGTTERPEIQGEARIAQASAKVPDLGLELTEIALTARNQGADRLVLDASVASGGGRLLAQGDVVLDPDRGWPVTLSLRGSDFQVVRLPEAVAYASPDLDVKVDSEQISVQGSVTVPKADIEIKRPPASAVTVSEDEVIVGRREETAPQKSAPAKLSAEVKVKLGDKVRFSGFGLSGRLAGSLDIDADNGKTLAQGEIFVRDGRYKAYGQDLTIAQGRLIFSGPLTNAGLDVRATRKSSDGSVTAILNVSGTLREPLVNVSSEPPLPEEEALAYLVTGRGLGEGSGDQTAILRQAALSKGLDKSQAILDRIAGEVGVDQLQVQQGATLEDSSLLLGKYLSPDLYVSYAVGLFDPQGALVLRYRLTDRLRLEAQSGEQQGVDLIYDVERD
ncbi:MAG: translocation/assembly module TamB domain-containing protein [Chromatiales bacterium]